MAALTMPPPTTGTSRRCRSPPPWAPRFVRHIEGACGGDGGRSRRGCRPTERCRVRGDRTRLVPSQDDLLPCAAHRRCRTQGVQPTLRSFRRGCIHRGRAWPPRGATGHQGSRRHFRDGVRFRLAHGLAVSARTTRDQHAACRRGAALRWRYVMGELRAGISPAERHHAAHARGAARALSPCARC